MTTPRSVRSVTTTRTDLTSKQRLDRLEIQVAELRRRIEVLERIVEQETEEVG